MKHILILLVFEEKAYANPNIYSVFLQIINEGITHM